MWGMEQISHGLCLRLLDQLWRNPEEAGHCVSALSLAASKGNADAVWALLELGAEVDMPVGKYGLTALIRVSELSQLFPCVNYVTTRIIPICFYSGCRVWIRQDCGAPSGERS